MARRRRGLSPDEQELWRRVVGPANPLKPGAASDGVPREPAAVDHSKRLPLVLPPVRPPAPGSITLDLAPDPHAALANANPHMDRTRYEKLRRGRMDPEARLDLHGMTSERAHAALTAFVLGAHSQGLRLVLVITGKGRMSDDGAAAPQRRGVLQHSLPHWLAAPPLVGKVLQVAPAHPRHGGGGAYYVYLRRQR